MSLLVRKIELAKWKQNKILDGAQPSADAITGCMKTRDNKLSLWAIDADTELEEAVLAIVAGFEKLDSIVVLSMDPALIEEKGLPVQASEGRTPYASFKERHRDVVNLNYLSLGAMAEVVVESIRMQQDTRFTRNELKRIVANAVLAGKLDLSELKDEVKKNIKPNLEHADNTY